MSGRLYTDESGALRVAADGSIHTDDCPEPPCCGEPGLWYKATLCTGGLDIYVLASAVCSNVTGGVGTAGTAIQWGGDCYLVDTETTYTEGEIPFGAIKLDNASWPCDRDGCTGTLCSPYREFRYCDGTPADANRLYIPAENRQAWLDAAEHCCTVWKIGPICVQTPSSAPVYSIGSGTLITALPGAYTAHSGCCSCTDGCSDCSPVYTGEYSNWNDPSPSSYELSAGDCYRYGGTTGRVLVIETYADFSRTEGVTNAGNEGNGSSTLYSGTLSGSRKERFGGGSPGILSDSLVHTGDAVGAGPTGVPPSPYCRNASGDTLGLETLMRRASDSVAGSPRMNLSPRFGYSSPTILAMIPPELELRPSYSIDMETVIGEVGVGVWNVVRYQIEWTSVNAYSCEHFSYTRSFDYTVTRRKYSSLSPSTPLHTQTNTGTMSATLSGRIVCDESTPGDECCDCEGFGTPSTMMAAPAPALGSMLGRITRASGASRLARMVRK